MKIDRNALYERCSGQCEKCGGTLPDNWAAHHRKLRSQGGKNTLDNIVALHHECHNLSTNSVHLNPKKSYETGFMVKSFNEPSETPITIAFIGLVNLTEEGTYDEINNNHAQ